MDVFCGAQLFLRHCPDVPVSSLVLVCNSLSFQGIHTGCLQNDIRGHRGEYELSLDQERMMTIIFIAEGGGRACNCQKFEIGRISRMY